MFKNPRVTLIVPVYNVAKYIAECIASIKKQSNPDFEVICIEDCSTDNSLPVLKDCIKGDNRFKIIQNTSNHGLSYNRNIGIREAKGEFVSFIDSDDTISMNYIETLVNLFNQYDIDGISFENTKFIDGDYTYIGRDRPASLSGVMTGAEALHIIMSEGGLNCESQFYMWRKDFLVANELYFYEGIYHEDNLFFFHSMIRCSKLLLVHDKLYNYRTRPNSIVTQNIKIKHVESMLYICDEIRKSISCLTGEIREDAKTYLKSMEYAFCNKLTKYSYDNHIVNKVLMSDIFPIEKETHRDVFEYTLAMLGYFSRTQFIFDDADICYISKFNKIIVYGAGIWARRVLVGLGEKSIDDFLVAVTDNAKAGKLVGNEIHQLNLLDVDYESTIVILAVGKKYKDEMREYAESLGFKHFLELRY